MIIVDVVYLQNEKRVNELKLFLRQFNLQFESDIDYSLAIYDDGKLVGTASKARNVLKCFAILPEYQGQNLTSLLVKSIEDRMFREGLYHFFIYTPSHNKHIFTSIGYKEVITSNAITLLENGIYEINSYLNNLREKYGISNNPKACIVMNGNPFTLGHLYLVESCAKENEEVIVFVVSEDKSSFPFKVRFDLIQKGTEHLKNVKVVETGPYLVSNSIFPSYFLKTSTDKEISQAQMDCDIFVTYYKPIFNIVKRYIGTEPYCEVTNIYNMAMKRTLPIHGVEVIEIERKQGDKGYISASKVRESLRNDDFDSIKSMVPHSTYEFLISTEAKPIIDNLKAKRGRH